MKRVSVAAAASLMLVFVSGAAVGGFAYHLYSSKTVSATVRKTPDQYRRDYMSEMTSRLKLSDDQAAKLNVILDETRARFREYRERTRPEMKQIHTDQVEKIKNILSKDQQVEYETMRQEREARQNKSRGPGC